MGLGGLNYQPLHIPFAAGLSTKNDPRASQPPGLDICQNVEFDDVGGLRLRKPIAPVGTNILGGGTLSNVRKVFEGYGGELLCFTDVGLYSWDAGAAAWVLKGTHLAVHPTEDTAFATTGDQINADRAELAGVIVYAWADAAGAWVAAKDKITGAAIVSPTKRPTTDASARPRLLALGTKIVLFCNETTDRGLTCLAIDPANLATSIAAASTIIRDTLTFNLYYDVVKVPGADQAVVAMRSIPTTQYVIGTVDSSLTISTTTKVRTCDGPIAVSVTPDGAKVQVVRGNTTNVQGDLLTLAGPFTDVFTAQAIGTTTSTINQIAAAHRTVQNGGQNRCYVFWSYGESADTTTGWGSKFNWVDTGNTLGTQAAFVNHVGVASRAFDYKGSIYVIVGFDAESVVTQSTAATFQFEGALQNTYYLYRDDQFLCGKFCPLVAGGREASTGRLSPVTLTASSTTFSWAGTIRRKTQLGGDLDGYGARTPRGISFTFDSNDARRTVLLGKTVYVAACEILQYDGAALTEVGFHQFPWDLDLIDFAAGNLAAGAYGYKMTLRSNNARGEKERSTTGTAGTATMGASRKASVLGWWANNITHKGVAAGTTAAAAELWRTTVNPTLDSPFYLATSSDPSATGDNHYLANDPSAMSLGNTFDNFTDAKISNLEQSDEDIVVNVAPPAASIIAANADRIFLAGVPGDPDRIWYSKLRSDGKIAEFNGALVASVPPAGGAITAIGFLNETLVVYRQRAVYALPGDGYDNAGGGSNYGPARLISSDCGCIDTGAVALAPFGHIFKSAKGWYALGRDWTVQYIGADVAKFDSDTVLAVHVVESQHQIRCVTNARVLVLDYNVKEWSEWTIVGLDATLWNGSYVVLTSSGPKKEAADFSGGVDYGLDVETSWIKVADLQGRGSVRTFQVLGEYRSAHSLRIRCARDYKSDGAGGWSYYDDKPAPSPSTAVVGGPLQVRHGPSQKRCQAIKVRLTAYATDQVNPPAGEALKLTGLALDVGQEPGLYQGLPQAQKV